MLLILTRKGKYFFWDINISFNNINKVQGTCKNPIYERSICIIWKMLCARNNTGANNTKTCWRWLVPFQETEAFGVLSQMQEIAHSSLLRTNLSWIIKWENTWCRDNERREKAKDWYKSARAISDLTFAGTEQTDCRHFSRLSLRLSHGAARVVRSLFISHFTFGWAHTELYGLFMTFLTHTHALHTHVYTRWRIWHMHNTQQSSRARRLLLTCGANAAESPKLSENCPFHSDYSWRFLAMNGLNALN